eukprot:Skav204552  [mRNA]  locus=scaffold3346:169443:173538:- [translate_table: standard]
MGGKCIAQTLAMEDFMTEEATPSNQPCCVAAFTKSDDASDVYAGEEGKDLVSQSLQGHSEAGEEAWKMKFAIRCSVNPVIMRFDGRVIARDVGDPILSRIHLVSVCGIDFASRVHDHVDLTHYIKNWKEVYIFDATCFKRCVAEEEGYPSVKHGRDFELSGISAKLNVSKTLYDLWLGTSPVCRVLLFVGPSELIVG